MKLRLYVTTFDYTEPENRGSYWASPSPPMSGYACNPRTYEVEVEVPDRREKVIGVVVGEIGEG